MEEEWEREDYERICNGWFALFIKYTLEKKHNVFLLKGRKLYRRMVIGT